MQTEAAPREPFTLGTLMRYKTTIVVVALIVMLGGYVRIVTQPSLYEATARLAVRFTAEAIQLQDVQTKGGSLYRPPLLEEEVKAYMVQITDAKFIHDVIQKLPPDEPAPGGAAPAPKEPSTAERMKEQFLRTYYDIRRAILSFIDAVLLTPTDLLSAQEQEVMKVLARLTVSAGTEASHVITVSYKNMSAEFAAKMVNSIALRFIEAQKKRVQRQDEAKFQAAVDAASAELVKIKVGLFDLQDRMGSPTLEEAIRKKYAQLTELQDEKARLELVLGKLAEGILAFDSRLSVGSQFVVGELERQFLETLIRYGEQTVQKGELKDLYDRMAKMALGVLEDRRKEILGRYKSTAEARLALVTDEISKLLADRRYVDVAPELVRLTQLDEITQRRLMQAESALTEAKAFNEQLENQNVSENVTLWQPAQVPPFPMPQHRGLKLMVVVAFGVLAGCGASVLQHRIRPRRVRRARPRHEDEVNVPLILLAEESKKKEPPASPDVSISFPPGDVPAGHPKRDA